MNLNDHIIVNADKGGDERFLQTFAATDVFFSIVDPSDQLMDGPVTASPDVEIKVPLVRLDIGRMALFYTSRKDARLSERFAGLPLLRAAEMVCRMPEADGMLIQSDQDAWFVATKDALRSVLGRSRA
jgi:hypothetical protein